MSCLRLLAAFVVLVLVFLATITLTSTLISIGGDSSSFDEHQNPPPGRGSDGGEAADLPSSPVVVKEQEEVRKMDARKRAAGDIINMY